MLHDTLVLTFPHRERRRWLTLPMALTLHAVVVVTLVLAPIFLPVRTVEPRLVRLFIDAAPPPPPPLKSGSPLVVEQPDDAVPKPTGEEDSESQEAELPDPNRLSFPTEIPEEILKPNLAVDFGDEAGFDFGHPLGMEGGVPGGVVGGVPGGVLGGVIGGTGTGVPRRFQEADVPPRPIRMPRPTYTVDAIRKKVSGEVMLQAVIDVQGRVKVIRVLKSVPELDAEAIRVVEEQWLFRPAMKNGRPVESLAELLVTFNLY